MEETNELCIKFGEKITVDKAEILVGGNAANVAVGASRLGLRAALVAEIGKDEFAQKIINTLSSEKVDISNVKQTEGQQSSFSVIINFKGERTIFSEHVKRSHDFNFDQVSTKWVYLTSVGEEWIGAYNKTVDFVKSKQAKLAFNPGTLQIQSGKASMNNILLITDVLFLNKEEAEQILNMKDQKSNINGLLNGLQKLGPKIVVITDGRNGSYAIDVNGNISKKGIVETKAIEKTGAGDAYSSGFLSAIINGKSIADSMDLGAKNSASVIGKVGALAGLLYV
jgi:ribokinase